MKKFLTGVTVLVLTLMIGVAFSGIYEFTLKKAFAKPAANLDQSPLKPVIDFARDSGHASLYATWSSVCTPAPIHSVSMSLTKYGEVGGKSAMVKIYYYDFDPKYGFKVTVWDLRDSSGNALMSMQDLDLDGHIDLGSTSVSVGPDSRGHQYIRAVEIPHDYLQNQFDEAIGTLPR